MFLHKLKSILLLPILFFALQEASLGCSMYKITAYGKTIVGCNHDTWLLTPRVWFETKGYGAAFTGARIDGSFGYAPQSGMNEYGLAFSRLAAEIPKNGKVEPGKKQISNQTEYLKDILHSCKTVEEVKAYIDQYDHSIGEDVFIYIDRSGRYLIVEPFTTTIGNDAKYVLANFCPSQISDFSKIKMQRYVNGKVFLKDKVDTSLAFCTALADTMHVCRKKIGDGTLQTSIWDLNEGKMNLYFYHDYTHRKEFILKDELAKGDHMLEVTSLFPPNKEFKLLANYQTAVNSKNVNMLLIFCGCLFVFSALFFLVNYFRKKSSSTFSSLKVFIVVLSVCLCYFVFVLFTDVNIYYFPAPYKSYNSVLTDISAFLPFVLLLSIFPLIKVNRKILVEKSWSVFSKLLLSLNLITYIFLIGMFYYWGFYAIFSYPHLK